MEGEGMITGNRKPNILFIMDDQHRFDYLGCLSADFVRTPNIDRLASRGVTFTHAFTNSPLCAPARIALASGLQPARLGALDNSSFLPPHVTTFYQRLRDNGYRVGCVGKLDLAKPDHYNGRYGDRPCAYQWGFTHPEECEGKMHAGGSQTPLGPYGFFLQEKGLFDDFHQDYKKRAKSGYILNASYDSVLPTEAFEDAYIGRRAAEWIEKVPDDFPWFQFVSFVGPHDPYDPPTEYADKYRNAAMPGAISEPLDQKPAWVKRKKVTDDPAVIEETRRQYCAAIELIDDQIGLILDALERRGMLEHTYIVFTSDHGEMLGDHGLYQKSVAYEQAIRIPLIVSGPDIKNGVVSDTLVELIDLNPTVCEWAGLPLQPHLDAKSIVPFLSGSADSHRTDIISSEYNFKSLRTRTHKLIQNFNDIPELYDLTEDPHELRNVAGERQPLVRELTQRLRQRFQEGVTYRE
jgi:arylsulfatase